MNEKEGVVAALTPDQAANEGQFVPPQPVPLPQAEGEEAQPQQQLRR